MTVIDDEGYRANVGIILLNKAATRVFWARRIRQKSWQFPQGGLNEGDQALSALYRELYEEVGLYPHDVEVLAATKSWFKYRLPPHLIRARTPYCIGQKQKWFLLQLHSSEEKVNLRATITPEFDAWGWVDYWHPLTQVISFKRHVYRKALEMLFPAAAAQRKFRK